MKFKKENWKEDALKVFVIFLGFSIAGQVIGGLVTFYFGLDYTSLLGQQVVWSTAIGAGAVGLIGYYAGKWRWGT